MNKEGSPDRWVGKSRGWTETRSLLFFISFFHISFLNNKSLFMICFIITYGFDVYSNSAKCMDVHSTRSSKSNTIASSLQVQSVHFVCSTNGEYSGGKRIKRFKRRVLCLKHSHPQLTSSLIRSVNAWFC